MGREQLIERILSDAKAEAEEIIRSANARAEEIISAAENRATAELEETKRESAARAKSVAEGKAAAARLDSAKILLAEKRRVMDEIYARALKKLQSLNERESLQLLERVLSENAEDGDEIVLAENFKYASSLQTLPVMKSKKLTLSSKRAPISGGCILHGVKSDKDLSFTALLNADMEEYQAEIARKLFVVSEED